MLDDVLKNILRMECWMKGLSDIHNHILYGVDDGAKDISESLRIIEDEYRQGVRNIIFTPHFHGGVYEEEQEVIRQRFNRIKDEVKDKYANLELYLGNEILYTKEIIELLNDKKINTLADSRYVLVEFMPRIEYGVLEKAIRDILMSGYIPIIAHCERYECLHSNIGKIHHLVESGVYIQVNADSVYSFGYKRFIKKLIDSDCLHFIATDAHNQGGRGVHFDKCIKYLTKKYDKEYVEWLLIENPRKVINNQYI